MTGPTFCTRASERVYITTSSGKDANGGSQGAVGDRRAAICGENVPGAGGRTTRSITTAKFVGVLCE